MARREMSRVGGFVHDIATMASLSDEPNNMRLLSDRSLYVLQNLSSEDITFLSRYGEVLADGFYLPVLAGSPEEADVEDAVDLIRRDLNSMAVEDLLECVCAGINSLVELGVLGGQQAESEPSDGQISVGPGEQFPDQESYFEAKCSAANAVFDTVLATVQWLDVNNIDLLGGVLGGMTTALIAAFLVSGPVGWAVTIAGVTIAAITTFLISKVVDFGDLETALAGSQDELVLSLFNASNTLTARNSFIDELEAAPDPTTAVERDLVRLMLSSDLLNLLFDPRQDVGDYQSPSPVDCGGATLQVWDFAPSGQGWSFRDDSTGTYSASGVWNSGAEAWRIGIVGLGTGTGTFAAGTILITGLSIAVPVGGSLQFDHGASGDGVITSRRVKAIFSDMTDLVSAASSQAAAGTVVLTFPEAKTVEEIEVRFTRNWVNAFDTIRDVLEVRVLGV